MVFTTESPPRVPKEERDALHALYGLPRPRPNSSLWKYHEVFRTGYVRHDPCGEVLQIESRQEELESCRREKRPYNKANTTYWETEIRETRAKTH
jgi:hypothetical protein